MKVYNGVCLLLILGFTFVSSSRVLELNDKFIQNDRDGVWFVNFYAPWCASCRRFEPVWAHVAQSLYNTPIKVAKVDCTRFTTVATHFKVRAYPTIMFIKGQFQHEYNGEREKDEMVKYAKRMAQPAVQRVLHKKSIEYLKEFHNNFFGYIGLQQGPLLKIIALHPEKYQPHAISHDVIKNEVQLSNDTSVFVYKEDSVNYFEANPELVDDQNTLNTTLDKWINNERFEFFPKITRANISNFMDTAKYVVTVIVSENKLGEITQTERDFRDMVESIIRKKKTELNDRFKFGWIGDLLLANSIAMTELTVPHLLVLNTTTSHYHIPYVDPVLMTPEAIMLFLEQIHNQEVPKYGGDDWAVGMYRTFYEVTCFFIYLWRENPVLISFVLCIPFGFMWLSCYFACCVDTIDDDDDDDEDEETEFHEKED